MDIEYLKWAAIISYKTGTAAAASPSFREHCERSHHPSIGPRSANTLRRGTDAAS